MSAISADETFVKLESLKKADFGKDKTLVTDVAKLNLRIVDRLAENISKTKQFSAVESFVTLIDAESPSADARIVTNLTLNALMTKWTNPDSQTKIAEVLFSILKKSQAKLSQALKQKFDQSGTDLVS